MTIIFVLSALFIAFTIACGVSLSFGKSIFQSYQRSLTELSDRFFSSQFMFVNASRMFAAYIAIIVVTPTVFWLLGLPWFVLVFFVVLMMVLPRTVFSIMEKRRRKSIVLALPDTLQQLGGALRAGSTFNAALEALVSERDGPIAQEFSLVLREQRLGIRLDESLENLGERVKSEDIDIVISAILIAQDVGGNLAEVLTRVADTLRSKISMEDRIEALTAQGVMQGYVVTALPTLILAALLMLENQAIMPLFTSLLGWIFLAIILSLQTCGGFFIRKVVSIDI